MFGGSAFPLTLLGDAALENGKITNTLGGLPDLPIGRTQLTIDGGASGLVTNLVDLCARGAGDKLSTTLTAQSGRTAALSV